MTDDNDDLFADDYVSARKQKFSSADELLSMLEAESADTKATRHAKHTRKPRNKGPEALAQDRLRKHLETTYGARVLRTNAGFIKDEHDNTIHLGEAGQSDLHAIIPIIVNGFVFGIFAAFEVKAGANTATPLQEKYIANIKRRGGIAVVIKTVIDIDDAIAAKQAELLAFIKASTDPA